MARVVKQPDERRSELIASAQKLFFTKGYESTSVSDIVEDVSVAKGTFYYYFDSKNAILEELVEDMTVQAMALIRPIVGDASLDAIEKWGRVMHNVGSWKTERKPELIAILKALEGENMMLMFRLQRRMVDKVSPEIARIIYQGVEEGVFDTQFPVESAEIGLNIVLSFSNTFTDILFHPEHYEDPGASARRAFAAAQAAIERVIGAPPGSMPLADDGMISIWFEESRELV